MSNPPTQNLVRPFPLGLHSLFRTQKNGKFLLSFAFASLLPISTLEKVISNQTAISSILAILSLQRLSPSPIIISVRNDKSDEKSKKLTFRFSPFLIESRTITNLPRSLVALKIKNTPTNSQNVLETLSSLKCHKITLAFSSFLLQFATLSSSITLSFLLLLKSEIAHSFHQSGSHALSYLESGALS